MSNSFIMTESIVRPAKMPYGRLKDNGFVGIEGEHAARALVVETKDDLSAFASVNLIIDDLDCGAMTKTTSGGTTTLSKVLTSSMIGRSGRKICQLIMVNSGNTVVQKSSQFEAYVGRANEIERSVDDGVTIIILSEAVTEMAQEAAAAAAQEAAADVVADCQAIADDASASADAAAQSASDAQTAAASIVVDATLDSTSTHAIQNKAVAAGFAALNESLDAVASSINSGHILLTSADFEAGTWTSAGEKANGSRLIRTKVGYPVKAGDEVVVEVGTNVKYWMGYVISDGTAVQEWGTSTYKESLAAISKKTITAAGTMVLVVANGPNYGNSTAITPEQFDATIDIITQENTKLIRQIETKIESMTDDMGYLYDTKIDEYAEASSTSYLYYPINIVKGQTYIIRIVFSAFSASSNRKYSLRTTTARYVTSAYKVDDIVYVDGKVPTIGEEYKYILVATGNANFVALELSVNAASACHLTVQSISAEDAQTTAEKVSYLYDTGIVSLNHELPALIRQGQNPFNRNTVYPLTLLHFSDIHGSADNLARMVDLKKSLGTLLDDTICTGDMAPSQWSSTVMDFWTGVDGAEKILMCLGNHDLANGSGFSTDQIGETVAYETYLEPYISNWDVNSAGENLTYWYKDYASRKVRLIGLNYLVSGDAQTAQNTWLASRLAETKSLGYAVVIAEHVPVGNWQNIDCNFTIIGKAWTYNEYPTLYLQTVQDFIDGGGEFACYIAGHGHSDYVGYNASYPEQLCIAVTTALTTRYDNDQRRATGEKSQDAANVVLVDTVTKTVKLIRVGADMDTYMRGRHILTVRYTDLQILAQS